MKVALIGASGFVGKALVRELLDRNHVVTAIVRHPEQVEAGGRSGSGEEVSHPGNASGELRPGSGGGRSGSGEGQPGAGELHAVKGDVFQTEALAVLLKGQDVVISAYNPGWTNPKIYEEFVRGSESIQSAVKQAGVKRLIVIGGAGSLEIAPGVQLVDTPEFPVEYKAGATAARDFLNIIRKEQELDWTFFSPAILMNPHTSGERKGHYRTALDNPVFDEKGQSVLSVEDLAMAIVDEVENAKHLKQRFTAAY